MVGHQTIRVTVPTESINGVREDIQEFRTILVMKEDVLTCVPACRDVVNGTFVFQSQGSCHKLSISAEMWQNKI
jgi:hypothetical protein